MNLVLTRYDKTSERTIGRLAVNGYDFCFTLEDAVREGPKVYGKTAIPAGTYQVQLTMSNRFKRVLPLLVDVPGFEGVRIHPGNTAEDTDGCILVGTGRTDDTITQSRAVFDALFVRLTKAHDAGEPITLTVE